MELAALKKPLVTGQKRKLKTVDGRRVVFKAPRDFRQGSVIRAEVPNSWIVTQASASKDLPTLRAAARSSREHLRAVALRFRGHRALWALCSCAVVFRDEIAKFFNDRRPAASPRAFFGFRSARVQKAPGSMYQDMPFLPNPCVPVTGGHHRHFSRQNWAQQCTSDWLQFAAIPGLSINADGSVADFHSEQHGVWIGRIRRVRKCSPVIFLEVIGQTAFYGVSARFGVYADDFLQAARNAPQYEHVELHVHTRTREFKHWRGEFVEPETDGVWDAVDPEDAPVITNERGADPTARACLKSANLTLLNG